jgi:hypothetical protein
VGEGLEGGHCQGKRMVTHDEDGDEMEEVLRDKSSGIQ